MIKKFPSYRKIILLLLIISLSGCASLKDSALDRFYLNLTAQYNIYFNAHQAYLKAVKQTEDNFVDYYGGILSIYRFPDETSGKSNTGSTDITLTKCSKIIEKRKNTKWIDDTYLLIGKAYFYRFDIFSAMEAFQFVEEEYPETQIAAEAMIWQAKCLYLQKKYEDAKAFASFVKSKISLTNKQYKDMLLTEAMIDIKNENYGSAINNLKEAISKENIKYNKTRYLFILAQINQLTGKTTEAVDYYKKVIKRNPPYEMAFNSKIEISRCNVISDEKSAKPIRGMLEKMLNDDKNIQYYDQIYLEMALLELKLGNAKKAQELFALSLKYNTGNENLKTIAYLELADYYFSIREYKKSKDYFDSTAIYLKENYPEYNRIVTKTKTLSELVKYLVIADTEDSLQYLANLPVKSRDSLINRVYEYELKLKAEQEKADQQRKLAEEQEMQMSRQMMQNRQQNFMQPPGMGDDYIGGSKWYFYNQSAVNLGKSEFIVKWGKRTLADNWRISQNKTGFEEDLVESGEKNEAIEEIVAILTEEDKKQIDLFLKDIAKDKQKYYLDIPFTQAQMEASKRREMESLKKSGDIFLENLNDTANAILFYEKLQKKYPDSRYTAQVYYILYSLYTKPDQKLKKQASKDSLVAKYPGSDYVILLDNPDFIKDKLITRNKEIAALYAKAYEYYLKGDCKKVEEYYEINRTKYPGNNRKAHFEYLKILCSAKTMRKDELVKMLNDFQNKYKVKELNDEVAILLAYLNGELVSSSSTTEEPKSGDSKTKQTASKNIYLYNTTGTHYFIYAFESRKYNVNDIKTSFSDYNNNFHSLEKLDLVNVSLNSDIQLIIVKEFQDKEKAFDYVKGIKTDENFLTKIKNRNPQLFIITPDNFTIFIKEAEISSYLDFYKRTYFN